MYSDLISNAVNGSITLAITPLQLLYKENTINNTYMPSTIATTTGFAEAAKTNLSVLINSATTNLTYSILLLLQNKTLNEYESNNNSAGPEGIANLNDDADKCYSVINFNCTVEEYLLLARGPKMQSLWMALPITILFVGIFLTGILGNVLTCLVIIRNSAMHTATNYYLFSLAVSDLLFLLLGLPYEVSIYWHQYPYNLGLGFCKFRALISEASTYVSVLTIVAFSMERFLAICHPLHLYTMSGFKRALRIIAVIWVLSFVTAVPFGVYTKINYLDYPPDKSQIQESAFCAMLDSTPQGIPLVQLSSCIFFVVPMLVIMILYIRMGMQIRSRTRHAVALGVQHGSVHGESRQSQSRKAIIRMLAAVVITFFTCWAPFHAQRLLYLYGQDLEYFNELNEWLFSVAGLLYYLSCTINPILYNVMSHRYRVAFRETLCGRNRSHYQNNGFCRDQSSFRETTVVTAASGYESSHLIRVKSVPPKYSRHSTKDRDRVVSSGIRNNGGTGGNSGTSSSSKNWKENNVKASPPLKAQLGGHHPHQHHQQIANITSGNGSETSSQPQSTTTVPISNVVVVLGSSANCHPRSFSILPATAVVAAASTSLCYKEETRNEQQSCNESDVGFRNETPI